MTTVGELKSFLNKYDDDAWLYIMKTQQGPEMIEYFSYTETIELKEPNKIRRSLEIRLKK